MSLAGQSFVLSHSSAILIIDERFHDGLLEMGAIRTGLIMSYDDIRYMI